MIINVYNVFWEQDCSVCHCVRAYLFWGRGWYGDLARWSCAGMYYHWDTISEKRKGKCMSMYSMLCKNTYVCYCMPQWLHLPTCLLESNNCMTAYGTWFFPINYKPRVGNVADQHIGAIAYRFALHKTVISGVGLWWFMYSFVPI